MEERINKFKEWLLTEKQFAEKEADSICSLYQRVNDFLCSIDKEKSDIFKIDDVKTYNLICNKWLVCNKWRARKMAYMTLKKGAVDFVKHRSLYAEFLARANTKKHKTRQNNKKEVYIDPNDVVFEENATDEEFLSAVKAFEDGSYNIGQELFVEIVSIADDEMFVYMPYRKKEIVIKKENLLKDLLTYHTGDLIYVEITDLRPTTLIEKKISIWADDDL